jgi:hypothetical protein
MKLLYKASVILSLALGAAVLTATPAMAQTITTGTISGTVVDAQGGVLPGATVVAVHTPTGTSYEAVTQADGRFTLLNVRVGGPYTVTVKMQGFKDDTTKDVMVALGEERALSVKLKLANVSETVQVTAAAQMIDPTRAGAGSNIPNVVKELLPTITRSINDLVRLDPRFNATPNTGGAGGDGPSVISVAGTTSRYNNLQIDGAANNDLFGLSGSSGTPGGAMESQPISLDAIQEIQLVISPYDVRQGGFSGGGINAITKSGTNSLHGTGFYFGRNQKWVGKGADNRAIANFSEKQGGGTIGGRIIQNKAFFFGSAEAYRRMRPVGVSVGSTGTQFQGTAAQVDQFISILKNTYGYDIGADAKGDFSRRTNNEKYFGRVDFNLARGHQLTLRHNYVNALTDIGTPTATSYKTPDNYYQFADKTNSSVAQLNSSFGRAFNELRVSYARVRDVRGGQPFETKPFPNVSVDLATGVSIQAGREAFSTANELDQDVLELTDSLTMVRGKHTLTLGTSNQFFKFRNLFIRDNFGSYSFSSLANFQAGLAQSFNYSFSATSNPQQASAFSVRGLSAYVGDQWRVRDRLTVTAGLRYDLPQFPDTPTANPQSVSAFGYRTDITPKSTLWSPRVGFNYDVHGDGSEQVRGGVGIFAGRPPYVWLSNQYGNTGIDFKRIGASFNVNNKIPFVSNPAAQPQVVTGATAGSFTNEIDVIDPDFKYPSVIRGNLAWDRKLPWGLYGSAEFIWSLTQNDVDFRNLNFSASPTLTGVGGRPFFIRNNTAFSDVILLTNTTEGNNWTASYEVRRPFSNGWFFTGSYSYNNSKSVTDTSSDQAASSWGNTSVPGNPNQAPLSRSSFAVGHRINASASYEIKLVKDTKATVSLFYSGQSGRPYTLAFGRDVNGDGRGTNDLLYIPTATDTFTYTGGSYNDLLNFVTSDPCLKDYVGKIIPRNACRAPWQNTLDGRVAVGLPFKKVKAEITLDAQNLINLFDNKGGQFRYAGFNQIQVIQSVPSSVTATAPFTGYNITTLVSPTFTKFLRDDLRSRWQLQLGGRISF